MKEVNTGKAFLTRIEEIVTVYEDTFGMFKFHIKDLKGSVLEYFYEELQEELEKGYEYLFEKYMPNLWEDTFNHRDPKNIDREFNGYYPESYFDEFYTEENGFDEWGATYKWINTKIKGFKDVLEYLNKKLKITTNSDAVEKVTHYTTFNWRLDNHTLQKLYSFLIDNEYIIEPKSYKVFEDAFSGNIIDYQPRIEWVLKGRAPLQDLTGFIFILETYNLVRNISDYNSINNKSQIFINGKNNKSFSKLKTPMSQFKREEIELSESMKLLDSYIRDNIK